MSPTESLARSIRASSAQTDTGANSANSSKRARSSAACEPCRSRKLGCDGRRPCGRCVTETKICVFEDRPERTPLTRARMTELEDKLEFFEKIWRGCVPGFSLDEACRIAKELGVTQAIEMARSALGTVGQSQALTHMVYNMPTPVPELGMINRPSPRKNLPSYPPTRQTSPSFPLRPFDPDSEKEPSSYEWHESIRPEVTIGLQNPEYHGVQDGMGGAMGEQGVSYMGLSSGATFLNAIKRLSSQDIFQASPGNPLGQGNFDIAAFLGGLPPSLGVPARLTMRLPPWSEIQPLVDSYFRYFHSLTPLVHEPTIRAQVSGAIPLSTKPGANVLLNMIFAMGAFDRATSPDADDGDRYYQIAWAALQKDMLEEGTLQLVQGLGIMANYLQRSHRPNAGYICLGIAIRMGLALGLHTPTTSTRASPLDKEMRARVWWALVTLEAGCSVTFGRPHALGSAALGALAPPLNCDDEHLTVSTHEQPMEVAVPTRYTALIVQSHLARATCSVHDKILHSSPAPTIEQVKWCDERITAVVEGLPPFMLNTADGEYRLARSVQVWRARDFRAILYRPVLLAAAWDSSRRRKLSPVVQNAIATCRTLAQDNLRDIAAFVHTENDQSRGSEWYTLYFAFQASLTLLLSVVWEPGHADVPMWRQCISTTATWFRQLSSMRRLGCSYAQILENIVGSIPSPNTVFAISQVNPPSDSPLNWAALTGTSNGEVPPPQPNVLDVDRYWMEIWGNDLAPANLNSGGWDQIFHTVTDHGVDHNGVDLGFSGGMPHHH